MVTAGCAGIDLLAYRATDRRPLDPSGPRARPPRKTIIVAGQHHFAVARIRRYGRRRRPTSFTIGTAALDGSFSPR
jgi:hypothetical protein